ncbi:hypothetical protein OIU77_000093 [Salix suchowensis]|uniref:Protein kinase domain-containing protein n=1 Tax=Salix suchowensis TaxID=1278906 RepID=A0ABQ9B564_9ROSI|nr:hypothetical protein OIU77_000093 [Salix suchowensis]
MAVAKINSSHEPLKQPCNCYRVSSLTETILETEQTSNLKDKYVLGEEIEIMTRLSGHDNVVDLKAVYEDENYVHLVMELCAGGELFQQLEKHGRFSEAEVRVLFKHLMQVVLYCHENGVVHRDLKPENILLTSKSSSSPIKLADFGLATYVKPGQSLRGTVGSPFYIAPEVLAGGYNQAADVWSAGVILYVLLSGMPPFWGKTKSRIFDAVRAADLRFPSNPWDHITQSAKELVRGMLCTDPSQRLTAQQVLDNSWMKYDGPYPEEPGQHEKQSCEEWGLGDGSFSTLMARDHDVSFGTGSPVSHGVLSSTFKCRSSFSSFLAEPSAPRFAPGGFSFHNGDDSNTLEFMPPVSSMPSFVFSSTGPVIEQGSSTLELSSNISLIDSVCGGNQLSEISLGKMLLLPEPSLCCGRDAREMENRPGEVKRAGAETGSRALGIHGKRNWTIGLGECEQLDLMVTESVIRWASCTHLPTAPSLRSSLVC